MSTLELPKYQSHKIVQAALISEIYHVDRNANETALKLQVGIDDFIVIHVNQQYVNKHKPEVGGYYIRYEDGYESWSPKEVFEKGNTLIKEKDWFDRLKEEHTQLNEKVKKLKSFIDTEKFTELSDEDQSLLEIQLSIMMSYDHCLWVRIRK